MAARIALAAPVLLCSLLAAAPALAESPEPAVIEPAPAAEPAPAPSAFPIEEAVLVAPAPEPTPEPGEYDHPVLDEPFDPGGDLYIEPEPEIYEPVPERRSLALSSAYISFGIAPGMTLHHKGFHPNTRFELEFGGILEHRHRNLALAFGVASQVTPYYERKRPSFGADVTATAMLGPLYVRTGLGALGGLPRAHRLHQTAAAVGGVVGVGLNLGREPMVRVGVDYDIRVNTKLEPVHTFLLALRLACCRND